MEMRCAHSASRKAIECAEMHANPLNGKRRVGRFSIPLPSIEARVVDLIIVEKEVETGQIGELAVCSPQVRRGYLEDTQATQNSLTKNGWLLAGDVVKMDAEGCFGLIAGKAKMGYEKR